MHHTASSAEVSKSFGRFSRQALQEPVTITHHGAPSLVLLSHAEYERLKSRDREVLTLIDFTEDDRAAIAASRAPADAKAFNGELS
jgi:PHD/YefM family antitoxin component YafN of YafNO toxin-antitoxin module